MKEVIAFQCEYCNKIKRTKALMKKHEAKCYKNPSLHSCYNCDNLVIDDCNGKRVWCEVFSKNISQRPWHEDCEHYIGWYDTPMPIPHSCKRFKEIGEEQQ